MWCLLCFAFLLVGCGSKDPFVIGNHSLQIAGSFERNYSIDGFDAYAHIIDDDLVGSLLVKHLTGSFTKDSILNDLTQSSYLSYSVIEAKKRINKCDLPYVSVLSQFIESPLVEDPTYMLTLVVDSHKDDTIWVSYLSRSKSRSKSFLSDRNKTYGCTGTN